MSSNSLPMCMHMTPVSGWMSAHARVVSDEIVAVPHTSPPLPRQTVPRNVSQFLMANYW